jgi:DNA topoisomerase-1
MDVLEAGDTEQERALYQLMWRHSLATQLEDAIYSVNTLRLEATDVAADDGRSFEFKAVGSVLTSPGWKALTVADATEEDEGDMPEGSVPLLDVDSVVEASGGELLKKRTRPAERYTLASLVKALEARGIGRPATFGSLTGNILAKRYVALDKQRKLVPTELGVQIVLALINSGFGFMELEFTKEMELKLDYVADGSADYYGVVSDAYRTLEADLARIAASPAAKPKHTCPKCGTGMRRIATAQRVFWVCSAVKAQTCDVYLDDVNGRPLLPVDHPCPKCKAKLKRWKRKPEKGGGHFWACPTELCATFMDDVDGKPVPRQVHPCPKCKATLRRCKRAKEKGGGHFWRCTGEGCVTFLEDAKGKPVEPKKAPCPKCKAILIRAKGKKAHFWRHQVTASCKAVFFDDTGKVGKPMPPRPAA